MNKNLISLMMCGLLFATTLVSCSNNKDTKKVATPKQEKEMPQQEVVTPTATEKENTNKQEDNVEQQETKAPLKYFLIADSFEIKANADKLLKQLEDKGFDARIIPTDFGMYRVAYKGFSDRTTAFNALKEETNKGKIVWLHIIPED